ncbi:MAG: hypothetical protein JRD87_16815, partial [Deltaproteobacteria bacterium]|nr:hypothetical protein [Deltaproteobacteria bacterium]MBW2671496.1 hypothetical protein [Deltaproteobacteria bacterium]
TLEKSGAGFYAETDDEYVDRIVTLLTDEEVYNRFSRNALNYVKEKISWDIIADKTIHVYEQFERKPECRTRYVFVDE